MRWRPLTWFLLSVFFFVAAVFFWRLGDEWAAKKTSSPSAQSTNQPQSPGAVAKPHAQTAPLRLLTQPGNLNAPDSAPSTNSNRADRFAHRLSNTTKPLRELIRDEKAILLQNALIDTAQTAPLPIPEHLRAQGDPGSYIVQSRGPLDNAFRAALNEAGATFVSYIPNNASLVLGSAAVAQKLAADARVQAVLRRAAPRHDSQKLRIADLALDVPRMTASRDGRTLDLTATEFQLLATLARHPGRIFTRSQLLDAVRGAEGEAFDRAIDAHVKNIRRKIEPDPHKPRYLLTVYGVGYKCSES